jgi:hypothetical protein
MRARIKGLLPAVTFVASILFASEIEKTLPKDCLNCAVIDDATAWVVRNSGQSLIPDCVCRFGARLHVKKGMAIDRLVFTSATSERAEALPR